MLKRNKSKTIAILALVAIMIASLTGCGGSAQGAGSFNSKAENAQGYYRDDSYAVAAEEAYDGYEGAYEAPVAPSYNENKEQPELTNETIEKADSEEKLVYTCNMSIETTEYAKAVQAIQDKIKEYDGIIQTQEEYDNAYDWYYSNYTKRSGTLTMNLVVRVPSKNYFDFVNSFDGIGKIKSKTSQVENITKSYNDVKATIEGYEKQQERLLEMMDQAQTIEEMVTIEDRLTEVEVTLNRYRSQLSAMDTDVAYSTVSIQLKEVIEYSDDIQPVKQATFIDRLRNTLAETWEFTLDLLEGLLFFIIRALPVIVIFGIIAFVIIKIIKKSRKNKPKKEKAPKTNKNNAFVINKPVNTEKPAEPEKESKPDNETK